MLCYLINESYPLIKYPLSSGPVESISSYILLIYYLLINNNRSISYYSVTAY